MAWQFSLDPSENARVHTKPFLTKNKNDKVHPVYKHPVTSNYSVIYPDLPRIIDVLAMEFSVLKPGDSLLNVTVDQPVLFR